MAEKETLRYANTILVPMANPDNAPALLQLALSLIHPDKGRVIALVVTSENADDAAKGLAKIKPVIEAFQKVEKPIKLHTKTANGVARGILDAVREENADLILMGLDAPQQDKPIVGTIPENVAAAVPCDVLMYRPTRKRDFKHIVIATGQSDDGRVACEVGILLAEHFNCSLEAINILKDDERDALGKARIEQALRELPGQEKVVRTVIHYHDLEDGLVQRTDANTLLIAGFAERKNVRKWLLGQFSTEVLEQSAGPVLIVARSSAEQAEPHWLERLRRWITPTLTPAEQEDVLRQAMQMARIHVDYLVLILIAAVLATLGLMTNSSAVIIGAMLVAPLMSPLIGLSISIATGELRLTRTALLTLFVGFALALGIATVLGLLNFSQLITSEMAARGTPTLLDMGVALASGVVGGYATARKEIPAALAGVAIAAALMPPICTIGLGLALGNVALATGATLLFATNISSIVLSAWAVFVWLGLRPRPAKPALLRRWLSVSAVLLIAAGLALLLVRGINLDNSSRAEQTIRDAFETADQTDSELIDIEIQWRQPLRIIVTLRSTNPITTGELDALQQRLSADFGEPVQLDVVVETMLRAAPASQSPTPNAESTAEDSG